MATSTSSAPATSRPPLFEYAYMGDFSSLLQSLKDMAVDERWEYVNTPNEYPYPILFNYIHHTFSRVQEEGKIKEEDQYSAFNTGLITGNHEEIFMLFRTQGSDRRIFLELCTESSSGMGRFSDLPERASYFSDPTELIFDCRLDLRVNIDHIVDDHENFSRFPSDIQSLEKHQLLLTFRGAVDYAKKRVYRNYKTAIPQYFRGLQNRTGHLQLLLPLCLKNPTRADLALAVFKHSSKKYYVGKTCLTLDMAINNARLIAKPDDEWLKA